MKRSNRGSMPELRMPLPNDFETKNGRCGEHGVVQATRYMPRIKFPFFLYLIRRARAKKKPFECPECGKPVTIGS